MSRRKTFKILPRHTAKGDCVKFIEKAIKRQVDKHKSLVGERSIEKKKSKGDAVQDEEL